MEIDEAMLMEIAVNGYCHVVSDAHDAAEGVCAETQMRMLAHVFEGLALFLHRVVGGAGAEELKLLALQLHCLT